MNEVSNVNATMTGPKKQKKKKDTYQALPHLFQVQIAVLPRYKTDIKLLGQSQQPLWLFRSL